MVSNNLQPLTVYNFVRIIYFWCTVWSMTQPVVCVCCGVHWSSTHVQGHYFWTSRQVTGYRDRWSRQELCNNERTAGSLFISHPDSIHPLKISSKSNNTPAEECVCVCVCIQVSPTDGRVPRQGSQSVGSCHAACIELASLRELVLFAVSKRKERRL